MRTDLKMTKTEIKNHLIEKFGDEIQNQTFEVVRYTSFCEMEKVYDLKYYREPKYLLKMRMDDGDPCFEVHNVNLNEMIDIISMDFSFGFWTSTVNEIENKYDLLTETLTELT